MVSAELDRCDADDMANTACHPVRTGEAKKAPVNCREVDTHRRSYGQQLLLLVYTTRPLRSHG